MGAVIATNRYGKYHVPDDLDHRPAVRLIKMGKIYEPRTIDFMMRHTATGDVIHAGTFFGDFLPALSSALAEDCKIWAFEPNPGSYAHAGDTCHLNTLENVDLRNSALSDRSGEILFRTHDDQGNPMGGHSHFVTEEGPGVTRVGAVRLDDVIPQGRRISILQLDVEGHERAALAGATRIIHDSRPILILEDFRRPRWLRRKFGHLGYQRRGRLHGNSVWSVDPVEIAQPSSSAIN